MKNTIFIFIIALAFSGCISVDFKSDYPEIEYYRLKQVDEISSNTGSIDGTLQIRDFSIGDELETNYILALTDETEIKRYYYHRWITDCSDLVTGFFINRFNTIDAFKGGVINSASIVPPDFVMEGQIVEMMAHNSVDNKAGANFVSLTLRITLIKRIPLSDEKNIVHTKIYKTTVPRKNNSVKTIPLSFSKAYSEISSLILNDIQSAILNYNESAE